MTTHDPRPETVEESRPEISEETSSFDARPVSDPVQQPTSTQARSEAVSSTTASSTDQVLFAGTDLSGLRSRWTAVQTAFVDDPRACVQEADGLVADVVEKLTAGLGDVRAGLEQQWDRGETVSTEDLRIALTHYREFFDRLIAI